MNGECIIRKEGQAIVELVVALVVILVLAAGIIQISWLGVRHSRAMGEARRIAGHKAMLDVPSYESPRFISTCTMGADAIAFSRDDSALNGDPTDLTDGIVKYAHPKPLNVIAPDNPVSVLSESAMPQAMFGLIHGENKDSVDLLPVVRRLIYTADSVEVQGSAWMTWTKGLY